MIKRFPKYNNRFSPLLILALIICCISFITRIILAIISWHSLDLNPLVCFKIFIAGLFYDFVVCGFFAIPVALYCWLMKDCLYQKKWQRLPLFSLFFIIAFLLLLIACGEIAFWNEFNVRFNFIAVDYLVYTNEILANIWQSYNITWMLMCITVAAAFIVFLFRKGLIASQQNSMRFRKRTAYFFLFLLFPAAGYFFVDNKLKNISRNNYVNELSGNGIYEFGAAFWHNEIDYNQFYSTQNDTANFKTLHAMLQVPNTTFTGGPLSIERLIKANGAEHKWNVILISVESLSADYLAHFGNKESITPYLDSLIRQSLFFENFYASGTRTVRGLEALSLAIPPTPGQSIVRRPHNENMFTIGSVLRSAGYDVNYIYGGNSFFDNMGYFFSHNGYIVLDKTDIPEKFVSHTTAWGIDDEGTFNFTLQQCDKSYSAGKLFFNHIMTVSNHRPYTYPAGRIDIPPSAQLPQGGVKYTDYAIHKFLEAASTKPWYDSTLFVIVADHCSRSAGKIDLPLNRYHIPCFIYAPKLLKPRAEQRLVSQIDLAPTILGLINKSYTSRFMGYDIYETPERLDRIFISTYEKLGYYRDGRMVILSPQKIQQVFKPGADESAGGKNSLNDSLIKEAIGWYQGASYLFRNGRYKNIQR